LVVGCAAPAATVERGSGSEQAAGAESRVQTPKRLTVAILASPKALNAVIDSSGAGSSPGLSDLERAYNPGLSVVDLQGNVYPILAEALPSTENGLWRVSPDGRMETTWQLRSGAQWHDGTPVTSADVLFTARVHQDRELEITPNVGYESIESIEAPDPRTVLVRWSRPYIEADAMFDVLMPSHILEREYRENKATFISLPFWTQGFVGTGAYRVRQFNHGVNLLLEANPSFVLGRPKIDEIDARFITDTNTLVANILAGVVEVTVGRNMPLDQALVVRSQWSDGAMDPGPMKSWLAIYPQFINPNPAVILDVRFRRALMHAIDRQEIMESLMGGATAVAHTGLWPPGSPGYADVERGIIRYDYDARRAMAMLEELGYNRASDGVIRDAAGRELIVPLQGTVGQEIQIKSMLAVADYWQKLGARVEQDQIPAAARSDRARRSERPGFEIVRQGANPKNFNIFHSSQTPLPENNLVGDNRSRYQSPQLDALIERHRVTIPIPERLGVTREIIHHMAENLSNMGLFYDVEPMMVSNRLLNAVTGPQQGLALQQVHQWDVK
jgi:peptide/nickel transport system substrate-binding protein